MCFRCVFWEGILKIKSFYEKTTCQPGVEGPWARVAEGEKIKNFRFFSKVTKLHEVIGNDQKSAWEHHSGVETSNFGDLPCPERYSGILEMGIRVESIHSSSIWGGSHNQNSQFGRAMFVSLLGGCFVSAIMDDPFWYWFGCRFEPGWRGPGCVCVPFAKPIIASTETNVIFVDKKLTISRGGSIITT